MKLKIRATNESNAQKTLTEADVDRGYRIKAIEKLSAKIGDAVTAAHYKYKPMSQTGFYIIPEFNYLSKFTLTGTDDEEPTFTIKLNDVHAQALPVNGKVLTKVSYDELISVADDIGLAMAKTLVSPASFNAVSENLSEEMLLEYGPWDKIKGFFSPVADFFAKKAADKAEKDSTKAILEGINETLSESLNDAIKALLKDGKQYVTVESKIDGNTLTLQLKCDFVTALTFNADPRDARKVIASKLLTPLGEVKVKGKSIPQVLSMVGKVLGIKFDVEDVVAAPATTGDTSDGDVDRDDTDLPDLDADLDADERETNDDGDWASLIGDEAFSHIAEGLKVLEAYKLGISADKYMEAFNAAKTPEAKKNVIRYFLFKETGGKLSEADAKKLDEKTVTDIADIIKTAKSFNPNVVFELLYILKFIQKHSKIDSVPLEFAKDLPDVCRNAGTLENVKSIIYNEILFNSSNDVATLQKLVNFWYKANAFKKNTLTKLSEATKQNLVDKFDLADDLASKTEAFDIKRELLIDKSKKAFRPLATIQAIEQAINSALKNGRVTRHTDDDEVAAADVDATSELDLETLDPETISEEDFKKLIRLATSKGGSATDRAKLAKILRAGLLGEE